MSLKCYKHQTRFWLMLLLKNDFQPILSFYKNHATNSFRLLMKVEMQSTEKHIRNGVLQSKLWSLHYAYFYANIVDN